MTWRPNLPAKLRESEAKCLQSRSPKNAAIAGELAAIKSIDSMASSMKWRRRSTIPYRYAPPAQWRARNVWLRGAACGCWQMMEGERLSLPGTQAFTTAEVLPRIAELYRSLVAQYDRRSA